jgi:hypothetical protein
MSCATHCVDALVDEERAQSAVEESCDEGRGASARRKDLYCEVAVGISARQPAARSGYSRTLGSP